MISMRGEKEYMYGVLDELETIVHEASGVPMRRGKAVLGRADIGALLDELRDSIPADLDDSERVREECREVVAEAGDEARRIVERAHEQAENAVFETELYKRSEQEAEKVVSRAERYAEEVSGGSEDYRGRVMEQLEGWFQDSLHSVGESRKQLSNTSRSNSSSADAENGPEEDDGGEGWRASSA